jgi:dUTP pyrophosphatase
VSFFLAPQAAINYTVSSFLRSFDNIMNDSGALSREEILTLLASKPPLIENISDIDNQVQPNGCDLTVRDISGLESAGFIGISNSERVLTNTIPMDFDIEGTIHLMPGNYLVTCNEIVNLPKNIMALGRPRSSLLRCGVAVHTAVWDAGYSGRSQALLVVYNPAGFRIARGARFMQLVFFYLSSQVSQGYNGRFQKENL